MIPFRDILGPTRPNFLILTPACVLLGLGVAVWSSPDKINYFHFALALLGGIAAHMAVNALNEYEDFKSGLDFRTQKTPFSGGTGTLPANPAAARPALITGIITLIVTALIGVYFAVAVGWKILPLGLLGLVVIVAYTPIITRHPIICLIAPGLGFGTLMVMGTSFVLTGEYSWSAFVASLIPFFLVANLLLLNQFPDVGPDKTVGRHHLLIASSRRVGSIIYIVFLFLAYLTLVVSALIGWLPKTALLGLATIVLAVPASLAAYRYADQPSKLLPAMIMNVIINIVTPVLVAIGLLVA